MRIRAAEAKVAGLREALAKAEASAAAAEKRLRRQQLSVVVVRERAVGRLGSMATLVHARSSGKTRVARRAEEGPFRQIVAIKEALDNLLVVQMLSARYHVQGRQNGRTIFEDVVKSTHALTNSKVAVVYPDWLGSEKAEYVALTELLSHFLLTTCGAVPSARNRARRPVRSSRPDAAGSERLPTSLPPRPAFADQLFHARTKSLGTATPERVMNATAALRRRRDVYAGRGALRHHTGPGPGSRSRRQGGQLAAPPRYGGHEAHLDMAGMGITAMPGADASGTVSVT
ncbi:hypothetical protein ADL19_19525 [Streptomyces purpurogeneiscleroticus]|nr:hypothetical protein ADL19_19525 [Streptomyces purpurogeneiscleroticus]